MEPESARHRWTLADGAIAVVALVGILFGGLLALGECAFAAEPLFYAVFHGESVGVAGALVYVAICAVWVGVLALGCRYSVKRRTVLSALKWFGVAMPAVSTLMVVALLALAPAAFI